MKFKYRSFIFYLCLSTVICCFIFIGRDHISRDFVSALEVICWILNILFFIMILSGWLIARKSKNPAEIHYIFIGSIKMLLMMAALSMVSLGLEYFI